MNCRFCGKPVTVSFVDLGAAPPSNSFLTKEQLQEPEIYYPLHVFVCTNCWLVQVDEYKKNVDIFNVDYVYFSSFSSSWLAHAKQYVEMITQRLSLDASSFVVEIASNDGYLLRNFVEKKIPCLGVEPSDNTSAEAKKFGVQSIPDFFGLTCANSIKRKFGQADLIIGNNVLAHVPDINDFVAGLAVLISDHGTITMEFPHLLNLIKYRQFDTIYHEHFSYLSLLTVCTIFKHNGLIIYDVEELSTHGGSLRIFATPLSNGQCVTTSSVSDLIDREFHFGLTSVNIYNSFQQQVEKTMREFLRFIFEQKSEGKRIVGYGAAAKGNTLLNYGGIKANMIEYVVDASLHKQGKFLPGSHIPVLSIKQFDIAPPDILVIFPWNLKSEVVALLSYLRDSNTKFITVIPELTQL